MSQALDWVMVLLRQKRHSPGPQGVPRLVETHPGNCAAEYAEWLPRTQEEGLTHAGDCPRSSQGRLLRGGNAKCNISDSKTLECV